MYIMPETFTAQPKAKLTVAVHNGDAFPESEVATKPERLLDAHVSLAGKKLALQDMQIDGTRTSGSVQLPEGKGSAMVAIHTKPNLIELDPEKFLSYLKEEGLTEIIDWRQQHSESKKPGRERYSKYAKSLVVVGTADDSYRRTLGFPIEIIPESNPSLLHPGDKLPVQVLLRGKPIADLQVESAWSGDGKKEVVVVGRTDAQGRISVPIGTAGKWRLHALKMERCTEPVVADWESFWASLTFEIQ